MGNLRTRRLGTLLVGLGAVVATLTPTGPAAAQPGAPPVEGCEGAVVGLLGCDLPGVPDLIGEVAGRASSGAMHAVASAVTGAAAWLLRQLGPLVAGAGSPDFTVEWWAGQYRVLLALSVLVAACCLLLAILDALAKASLGGLGQALGVDVPVAAVTAGAAPVLVGYLIHVADWISDALGGDLAATTTRALASAAEWFTAAGAATANPGVPIVAAMVAALLATLGGVFVFLELLLRANAIYLVTALVPVLYAARIWPVCRPFSRKLTEVLVAIILAKPVVVLALALGSGAAGSLEGVGDASLRQFGQALAGSGFLLLAALSPWAILALLPAVQEGVAAAYRQRTAATAGPRVALQTAYTGSYLHRMAQGGRVPNLAGWRAAPPAELAGTTPPPPGGMAGPPGRQTAAAPAPAPLPAAGSQQPSSAPPGTPAPAAPGSEPPVPPPGRVPRRPGGGSRP